MRLTESKGRMIAINLKIDWEDFKMKNMLKRLWQEEEGQDLVEYGLLVVLIALFAIAAMGKLATAISTVFSGAASNLTAS